MPQSNPSVDSSATVTGATTGARLVVDALLTHGVERVFCVPGESFLAVQYQLVAGARLFNVVGQTGFFIESGLKNHINLLSDGQFNGYFLTVGTIFTF